MASDIFIKIGDIKGESTDDRHKDQIASQGWAWGVSATAGPSSGSGSGAGKPTFLDLSFSHSYDKASPLLMKACATGQHLPEAVLTERKSGERQADFLTIKMTDVVVTSVSPASFADGQIRESVALRFAKVELSYSAQKSDGSLEAPTQFRYDIAANRPL